MPLLTASTPPTATISKRAFHAKQRSKARRRRARAANNADASAIVGHQLKAVTKKRRCAAIPLQASSGSPFADISEVLRNDAADAHRTPAVGLQTDLAMEQDQLPVTLPAFLGKRDEHTAHKKVYTKEEGIQAGLTYVAWNGQ